MTALLQIENLHKYYGGVHALNNISLSLEAGTVLGLVGDNGAGKSTLMKCITGAERQDNGQINFDGNVIEPGNTTHSRSLGIEMIYQNLNLCPQLDVTSNVFLGREIKGKFLLNNAKMKKKARDILSNLNAEIDTNSIVNELSGGQQQAIAIARAMAFNPKLIIMDEPTAALGVREVQKVLSLVKNLKKQGITVIIISHRLADIFEVADQIIFMRHGENLEDKSIDELSLQSLTKMLMS